MPGSSEETSGVGRRCTSRKYSRSKSYPFDERKRLSKGCQCGGAFYIRLPRTSDTCESQSENFMEL